MEPDPPAEVGAAREEPTVTSGAAARIFAASAHTARNAAFSRCNRQSVPVFSLARVRREVLYLTMPLLTTQVPKVSRVCSISENPAPIIAVRRRSALRKVSTERGR